MCLFNIEKTLESVPGDKWIKLESTYEGIPHIMKGYRYSLSTKLYFVATKDAESTNKGTPYQMKFATDWGHIHIKDFDQPEIISRLF